MMSRKCSPSLLGLVVVRALGELAATAMLPFVVLWAHDRVGLPGPGAGALFLVQAVGEFTAGLLVGSLADRLGRRRVLVVSAAGMALGYGLLAAVDSPLPAFGLFLVAGVFESAFHPVIGALVGDAVPEEGLRRAFGLVRIGTALGRVLGPLLGAGLILLGLRAVFVAAGALLLAAALVAAIAVPASAAAAGDEEEEDPELPPGTLRALVQDPALAVLVLAAGLLAIAFTWFEVDGLVVLRRQAPLAADAYAALFAIAAVTVLVTQVPVGRFAASCSPRSAIVLGGAIQGAGLGLLVLAPLGYGVLVGSVVLTAIGEALAAPAIAEVVTVRAGVRRRASYQAALSISQDIGGALGPMSGLALAGAAGPVAVWTAGAVLSVTSGAMSARAARASSRVPATAESASPVA